MQLTAAVDGHQGDAIGQVGDIGGAAGVTGERDALPPGRDIPHSYATLVIGSCQPAAVRRPRSPQERILAAGRKHSSIVLEADGKHLTEVE